MSMFLHRCFRLFSILQLQFFGVCNIPLERYFQDLCKVMLQAPKFLNILAGKLKKQTCNRLVITEQAGQKNRNGKTTTNLFLHNFLLMIMWAQTLWMSIFILLIHLVYLPECWCCENGCLIWWFIIKMPTQNVRTFTSIMAITH